MVNNSKQKLILQGGYKKNTKTNVDENKNLNKQLGINIKIARSLAGLSQTELANKIGVSYQQIQKYENGSNQVPIIKLVKISDLLKVDINNLLQNVIQNLSSNDLTKKHSKTKLYKAINLLSYIEEDALKNLLPILKYVSIKSKNA